MKLRSKNGDRSRLPFGRYRGLPLSKVPREYLMWVLRAVKLSEDLRVAVSEALACRDMFPPLPPDTRVVREGRHHAI